MHSRKNDKELLVSAHEQWHDTSKIFGKIFFPTNYRDRLAEEFIPSTVHSFRLIDTFFLPSINGKN